MLTEDQGNGLFQRKLKILFVNFSEPGRLGRGLISLKGGGFF